jgi:hypothetical protein
MLELISYTFLLAIPATTVFSESCGIACPTFHWAAKVNATDTKTVLAIVCIGFFMKMPY